MNDKDNSGKSRIRFAIYARYSSEMQSDLSIEAQMDRCQKAIAARGGVVVAQFEDKAISGWSLDRPGFQAMKEAASHGKFDAVMFWKFDRLARNHEHVVMIKMLLRKQYDLKLYCVEGFSEDDDNSAYSAMMEQMLAVIAAFYSRNLSSETKRGKQQRAMRGDFNGSKPPLGYDLVTLKDATEMRPSGLYINPRQAALVRRAFRKHATGAYSDLDIAHWLNQRPLIKALRKGKAPIGKDMVREMLQNRLYTGRVGHTDTIYRGALGEQRTTKRNRAQYFEGKHSAIISDELFDRCQEVRKEAARTKKASGKVRTYLLNDRVICQRCAVRKPAELDDERYGYMHPTTNERDGTSHYRCTAVQRGYSKCGQKWARIEEIDQQLISVLSSLRLPDDVEQRIEQAVTARTENAGNLKRMEELQSGVDRVDLSWNEGFISEQEYREKRRDLQREIESLRPVDYDDLNEAADLIRHFQAYWDGCATLPNAQEARKELVARIVQSVYVYDRVITTVVLHRDFAIVLGQNETARAQIARAAHNHLSTGAFITASISRYSGDDGSRTRDLCLDRAVC